MRDADAPSATKPRGRHPHRRLSAAGVRTHSKPGRYADGNGLYLLVDPSGAKRWVLRTVVSGRRCDLGLGSAQLVSLADAREDAARLRRVARAGGDPISERRRERRAVPTFREAAVQVHAAHKITGGVADSDLGLNIQELGNLARHYWMRAGEIGDPEKVEADARSEIVAAVDFAASRSAFHVSAQRLLNAVTIHLSTEQKRDQFINRLHRAIWLMAQRLFETSIYDAGRRCATECLGPRPSDPPGWRCLAVNDPPFVTCARSLVFPYLHPDGTQQDVRNFAKAANAIAAGFSVAPAQKANGQSYTPTAEAVRKAIGRFLTTTKDSA